MLRIAITAGDPAGIGPELLCQVAKENYPDVELVVLADASMLQARADLIQQPLTLKPFIAEKFQAHQAGRLSIIDTPLSVTAFPGQLDARNSQAVLQALKEATQGCLTGQFAALVTGPMHKGVINEAGIAFTGHTEYLAAQSHTDEVVMMLAAPGLRVALVTTHLPLSAVAQAITAEKITRVTTILANELRQKYGIAQPKILCAGLNPHAGENGYLGHEEIDTINPTLAMLQKQGIDIEGSFPADTLFSPDNLQRADAFLAMYHDQGLPVLKFKGFGQAINITLGLPFIRTSVDHGVALSLAGRNLANPNSFHLAIQEAIRCAQCHKLVSV